MSAVKALVLRTAGTNCDQETAHALRLAGAVADIVHVNALIANKGRLQNYQILILPGGFSYGDDIAAGKILANELRFRLGDVLRLFVTQGRKVIGICNGFQVLVKTGFLPGNGDLRQTVSLTCNDSGRFQCQWVRLTRERSVCNWLNETDAQWDLPIAHGEGKFVTLDAETLKALERSGQVVFRYRGTNPNGSVKGIAGICNAQGNVVGLMPHPERHVNALQHPEWTRRSKKRESRDPVGLQFFKAAVAHAGSLS
jgi:phosphoribosylformylglycinamidine synthase